MYHARSNLPCSRYTNEIYAQARSGRAKRATLLVYIYVHYTITFVALSKGICFIFRPQASSHYDGEFRLKDIIIGCCRSIKFLLLIVVVIVINCLLSIKNS